MNSKPSRSTSSRHFAPKVSMAIGISVACGLFGGNACAQAVGGVTVNNPSSFSQTITNFAKTIQQYAKDIAQYQAVLQHYQQQLVSLTHMNLNLPTMQNSYQEISDSDAQQQVVRACPSTDGSGPMGIASGLLQVFTPSANASILDNQRTICEQIQFRQIDKYNLTVKMMKRLQDYSDNVKTLQQEAEAGGTSQGASTGANTNIQLNITALDGEMKAWNGQIAADDQIATYLQGQQSVQAQEILRGSNTFLGNVIQAGAFAAAFH